MKEFYKFVCSLGRPVNIMQGTFGSLVGVVIASIIHYYDIPNDSYLLYSIIILYTVGMVSIILYDPKTDNENIIIDEVAGQMLSIYLAQRLFAYYMYCIIPINYYVVFILINFAFFRAFDIFKPLLIWMVDRNIQSPLGIMLDDVLAALYASILSVLILSLFISC